MTSKSLKKRYGIVVLLDALGASSYSDDKIKKFLSARTKLNEILANQAKVLGNLGEMKMPNTYTFGDTLIVTIELRSRKKITRHIYGTIFLMQNYLYYSLEEGILLRGAFSIGSYIDDNASNTVMGEAISDAASWYEKTDWIGLSSTPKTNNILEYHFENHKLNEPMFIHYYPVPMKDGREINLYTISWAGRFFQDLEETSNPKKKFLELLKDQLIPPGTESKFENTKKYFNFIEDKIIGSKSM
jgi:hypothetical protein